LPESKLNDYRRRYAHTLIELIIVLAVVRAAISICRPLVNDFFLRSRLKYSAEDIVPTLRVTKWLPIIIRNS